MINIIKASRELTPVEQYLMTASPGIKTIKTIPDGTKIEVEAYMVFEDIKEEYDDVELLSILATDKNVYCCQSRTFRHSFLDIANIMTGNQFTIVKTSGATKGGREFINCELDVESLV